MADPDPADAPKRKPAVVRAVAASARGARTVAVGAGSSALRGGRAYGVGLACTARGLGRLIRTPALWGYGIAPVLVAGLVLTGLFYWLVGAGAASAEEWATATLGPGWAGPTWMLSAVVLVVLALLVLYFAFPAIVRVAAAPFLALLADKVYEEVSGRPAQTLAIGRVKRWIVMPIFDALLFLVVRVFVTVIALPLNCIPVAGSFLFAAVLVPLEGMDLLDIAQSARAVPVGERLRFAAGNVFASGGLGTGSVAILLVPGLNVFLLPALVVGAVLLDAELSPDFADERGPSVVA